MKAIEILKEYQQHLKQQQIENNGEGFQITNQLPQNFQVKQNEYPKEEEEKVIVQ